MIVAHRGYFELENQLEAFYISWSNGVHICECDVRLTKDDILVVTHDPSQKKISVKETNYRELNFPKLLDVLNMAKDMNSKLIIEMKTNGKNIGSKLAIFLKENHILIPFIELIMSFSKGCLHAFYETYTDSIIPLYLLTKNIPNDVKLSNKIQGYYVKYDEEIFDNENFKEIIKNTPVGIWGLDLKKVDNKETIERLQQLGVRYINTDKPLSEKVSVWRT